MKYLTIAMAIVLTGCADHKAAIEKDAGIVAETGGTVREHAGVIRRFADEASAQIQSGDDTGAIKSLQGIRESAGKLDAAGERLQLAGDRINDNAQHVKNVTPLWVWVLGNLLWIGGVLVAVVVFWPVAGPFIVGLIPVFGQAIAWLVRRWSRMSFVIPKDIREKAKLDAEALGSNPDSKEMNVTVTASRARSPLYDAAFRLAKGKK